MWICDTHSDTLYAMGVQHAKELMITPQRLRQGGAVSYTHLTLPTKRIV